MFRNQVGTKMVHSFLHDSSVRAGELLSVE